MQNVFFVVKNQRVAGIWTTLETSNDVVFVSKVVDNFAFPFITPL